MLLVTPFVLTLLGTMLGLEVCHRIAGKVSSATDLYYPGSTSYAADNKHYAISSSQASMCSVEPGSAEDLGIILGILGETNTRFGVKGGGHATNQGFSSTTGVQIAMTRFNEVTYDCTTQTAVIGAGNIWDDVYKILNAQGVNVLGARVSGIGVAGFTLGGGYAWLSNQYGLAIDNIVSFELVTPSGTITSVTEASDADLFFSLKGGNNNFGIVTRFTLKAFPQSTVWGGSASYSADNISVFTAASAKFSSEVSDPKAAMIMTYGYSGSPAQLSLSGMMFYDGPTPPGGIFDDFLALPSLSKDIKSRSFYDFIMSLEFSADNDRVVSNDIPVLDYSESTIKGLIDELNHSASTLFTQGASLTAFSIEPFLPTIFDHAPANSSAYPSSRERAVLLTNLNFQWVGESHDSVFHAAAGAFTQKLGVPGAPRYPNYAIAGTPVKDMYGEEGVRRMEATRERVDPRGVMRLTGGFKV
ncbi:FAD-binding domain-containing protein [Guyanagaster necrorhizus]|uniref:FAD-binding domain-containing protein n=1 Tax=Guyanagaster necrorhizus TaxID=856835 RepID=A0A9P7VT01_9AGAR|nr:FAD-binding domain-containing protein [Guyanagaster necrorhizus MCA 3950]KAG7445406.1 FAD-binding domain-containing protein [Guyanagaster necrorhizus MCA 3950]